MDKFFNYGEPNAANIDWSSAKVQEKKDGSIVQLFFYDSKWNVATSGSPDASGDVGDFNLNFNEYFWNTFNQYGEDLSCLTTNYCFFFELCGPINRIVVRYLEPSLTLLGARNLLTQEEISVENAAKLFKNIPSVRSFPLNSFEEIIESCKNISPFDQEGFVVVDKNFNRVKCKTPQYVSMHHLRDSVSVKSFVEIVRSGETSEVLNAFPEYADQMNDVKNRYEDLIRQVSSEYEKYSGIESRKDFALAIKNNVKCEHALFSVKSNRHSDFKSFFKDMRIEYVMELMGLKSNRKETNE
jgi:T4 RnlA family RNA ligase